jgi:two-component system chemotaxis sensor kinase CheA
MMDRRQLDRLLGQFRWGLPLLAVLIGTGMSAGLYWLHAGYAFPPEVLAALGIMLVVPIFWGMRWFAVRSSTRIAALFDELAASQASLQRQFDAKSFLADLAYRLQHANSRGELGKEVLSKLADRLACRQGLLAVATGDGLEVVARYGAAPDAQPAERYGFDDGLIGQCARSRSRMQAALPDDAAWRIRSGLGHGAPAELRVLPLEYGGDLVGVIELGFAEPLDEVGEILLEQLLPVIALPLYGMRAKAAD